MEVVSAAAWRSLCRASTCRSITLKPEGESQKTLSEANYKLRKAKSLVKHTVFIISTVTPLSLWPPCLNQSETINVEDSLETEHPAGIMHYGAAFTQECMLMMICSAQRGGWQGENQIMLIRVFEGGGEIEDTVAFKIQALVKRSYIFFMSEKSI